MSRTRSWPGALEVEGIGSWATPRSVAAVTAIAAVLLVWLAPFAATRAMRAVLRLRLGIAGGVALEAARPLFESLVAEVHGHRRTHQVALVSIHGSDTPRETVLRYDPAAPANIAVEREAQGGAEVVGLVARL